MRRARIGRPRAWALLLLLLATAAHQSPLVHDHTDGGLFSDQCPLARLAVGTTCAAVAEPPVLAPPATQGMAFVVEGAAAGVVFPHRLGSRSPPLIA